MTPISPADPLAKSADLTAGNLGKLRELFPDAFTEGRIDFEVLKELLGGAVDEGEEKYGLNWHGKRAARRLALTPSAGTLRPGTEKESRDWATTQNLMIEGDNLEVLKLLQKSYTGKVKLIYIDPPYNTGKDFVYPDNFSDNIKNYKELTGQTDDGVAMTSQANSETGAHYHTKWLNMMYSRIKIAHTLLSNEGHLFISIDQSEEANARHIIDEVFGSENFLSTITWRRKKESSNDGKGIAVKGEFILACKKSDAAKLNYLPLSDAYLEGSYNEPSTEYPEDKWRPVPIAATKGHQSGGYEYTVTSPAGTKITKTWLYPQSSFEKLVAENRIYWGKSQDGIPQRVMYAKESNGTLPDNLWIDIATNKEGKNELTQLMGGDFFDTVKPVALIEHILKIASTPDSLILDFFAGSGTTGHAVMAQNAADGGTRRYILVQLPEPTRTQKENGLYETTDAWLAGYPTIAEITKARLRRAADKIRADNPLFAGDLGFRVYKLDSSNVREWDPETKNVEGDLFAQTKERIKDGRTAEDLLAEVQLKFGLPLVGAEERRMIAGHTCSSFVRGTHFTCLSESIPAADAEALAAGLAAWRKELDPDGDSTAIFRDDAFPDDIVKTNLTEQLRLAGITTVRSL